MKNIFEAPFVMEMREATANMYRLGWDERNGGNISYLLDEKEVAENITEDSFDDILYMLDSYGVQFSISTPDEFEFDSESESESLIDQLTLQLNLFESEESNKKS